MTELAKSIVRDGEGATKLIEIVVEGAKTAGEAKTIAYQIARSNLVKTAFYGGDPNWGRVISAVGAAGVPVSGDAVELYFDGLPLFRQGQGISSHLQELAEEWIQGSGSDFRGRIRRTEGATSSHRATRVHDILG